MNFLRQLIGAIDAGPMVSIVRYLLTPAALIVGTISTSEVT